jgi:nucleoside-diphosphate-sugar epimerase
VVAGPDAQLLLRELPQRRLPLVTIPVMPNPGTRFQLVHHDDVAAALVAAVLGDAPPGAYNLAGEGTITLGDLARALGWLSVPVPSLLVDAAALGANLPLLPNVFQWISAARVPVIMDTTRAQRELGWAPQFTTAQTLRELVAQ